LKQRQLVARERGYGPDYIAGFIEMWKKDMCQYARQHRIRTSFSVWHDKRQMERRKELEEERARKVAWRRKEHRCRS
jgi:hypothetical protein